LSTQPDPDQPLDPEAWEQDLKSNIQRALRRAGEVKTNQNLPMSGGALIDDPDPFATLETWERHLADLKTLPDSTEKELAVERAEKSIMLLKQMRGRD
jgi:hypothetical protein